MTNYSSDVSASDDSRASFTAFVQLVHQSKLWPTALQYVAFRRLPRDRAHDVLQEALIRTWKRWDAEVAWYDHDRRMAFIRTTMHYVAWEHAKDHRARGEYEDLSVVYDQAAASEDVESRAFGRIALSATQEALASLTEDERRLIELGVAGVPSALIGQELKITPTNARNRLKRARDRLRSVIDSKGLRYPGPDEGDSTAAGDVA